MSKGQRRMPEEAIYGWADIAKHLGCSRRMAEYMAPILYQYGAIERVKMVGVLGHPRRIKGYPGLLDACKLDMAGLSMSRLQKKWHGEVKTWVTRYRFYITQRMKDRGISLPPEMCREPRPEPKQHRKEPLAKSKTPRRLHRRRDKTTVCEGGDGI